MGPELLSEASKKAVETLERDRRSAAAKKGVERMGTERRSAAAKKGHETRKRKALLILLLMSLAACASAAVAQLTGPLSSTLSLDLPSPPSVQLGVGDAADGCISFHTSGISPPCLIPPTWRIWPPAQSTATDSETGEGVGFGKFRVAGSDVGHHLTLLWSDDSAGSASAAPRANYFTDNDFVEIRKGEREAKEMSYGHTEVEFEVHQLCM